MDWMQERARRWKKFSTGLHPLFVGIYRFFEQNLPSEWAPYHGVRSEEEQANLYAIGRVLDARGNVLSEDRGKVVTFARPGDSPHLYGCAFDCTIFDGRAKPIWDHREWPVLGQLADKCGAVWGGTFRNFVDRPHVELPIRVSWRKVGDIYRIEGMPRALKFIESNFTGG